MTDYQYNIKGCLSKYKDLAQAERWLERAKVELVPGEYAALLKAVFHLSLDLPELDGLAKGILGMMERQDPDGDPARRVRYQVHCKEPRKLDVKLNAASSRLPHCPEPDLDETKEEEEVEEDAGEHRDVPDVAKESDQVEGAREGNGEHWHPEVGPIRIELPVFLSNRLQQLGARFKPMRGPTGPFFDADDDRLRLYLGTYFPRTVIESWNIFTEVLAIPIIREAFARKERIRLLDIGSGTGGAVVGVLLAFQDSRIRPREVEVTPFDGNQGALDMQQEIMATLKGRLPFRLVSAPRYQRLPSDRAGFARALSAVAEEARPYDLITCWKCLCEFYNFNFSSAHGIIRSTLDIAARMLLPYGLCVVADVTTTDNNYESFAKTLNREANAHDTALDATARTVLPLPCGRSSGTCTEPACYTQRRFAVSHRLVRDDESKIAYRVLAPASFAKSVTASFTNVAAYRVNAARPAEACFSGRKRQVAGDIPSGYTDFFAVGE